MSNKLIGIISNEGALKGVIEEDNFNVKVQITESGPRGIPGKDGYTPVKGIDYFDGEKGEKGDQGEVGPKGDAGYTPIKGVDYFDGDKGDKGDKGDTGERGEQGIQGIQGEKGETGERGIQGETGEQGIQGPKGDDGYTPVKGVDYFDGIDGIDGKDGEQGIQGPKGDKGEQGEQGPKGDKGDTGERGLQGIQGIQGERGLTGEKGDTGARGFQGNAGKDGANGSVTSYDEDTKTLIISNGTATGGGVSNPKTFALIDDIILLEDTQLVSITPSIACDHYYLKFIPYGTTKNTGSVSVYFYYAKVSGKSNLGVRLNPFTQNTPVMAWSFSLVELWKYNDSVHAFQMSQTSNDPTPETTTSPTAVMSWPITGKQYHPNAELAIPFVLQCWGQYMGAGTRIVLYGEVDTNV